MVLGPFYPIYPNQRGRMTRNISRMKKICTVRRDWRVWIIQEKSKVSENRSAHNKAAACVLSSPRFVFVFVFVLFAFVFAACVSSSPTMEGYLIALFVTPPLILPRIFICLTHRQLWFPVLIKIFKSSNELHYQEQFCVGFKKLESSSSKLSQINCFVFLCKSVGIPAFSVIALHSREQILTQLLVQREDLDIREKGANQGATEV